MDIYDIHTCDVMCKSTDVKVFGTFVEQKLERKRRRQSRASCEMTQRLSEKSNARSGWPKDRRA
jgi:hypothetical protein